MLYYLSQIDGVSWLRIFRYVTFRALAGAGTAFVLSLIVGPWMIEKLRLLKIGQQVRTDEVLKMHGKKSGTPTMGGVLIILTVLISTLLWSVPDNPYVILSLATMCYMGAVGFLDDYLKVTKRRSKGLGGRAKLALQVAWAVTVVAALYALPDSRVYVSQLMVPFLKVPLIDDMGPVVTLIFLTLVMVGSTNAVNLTDGLDGLAIGCSNSAALAYTVLAYVAGNAVLSKYLQVPHIQGAHELAVFCQLPPRRGPRFPLVQLPSRARVHGRHGQSRARRLHRDDRHRDQAGAAAHYRRRRVRLRGPERDGPGRVFQIDGQAHLEMRAGSSSLRGDGKRTGGTGRPRCGGRRDDDHDAVLDPLDHLRPARSRDLEDPLMNVCRHALVLGLGTSGESAAKLLLSEGSKVTVLDGADNEILRARAAELMKLGAEVALAATHLPASPFDLCVVSPGIAVASPWVVEVRKRGINLIPEIELGWSRHRGRVIAVTGTNGKSTAVKWIAETLQAAGLRAVPAGNYGLPATQAVMDHPDADWLVLEVSSFQLETINAFRADAAVLLNLLPNHLDRHEDMKEYVRAKARIFMNARAGDACVVHEDHESKMRACSTAGTWLTFGASDKSTFHYKEGKIISAGKTVADLSGTFFGNEVLGVNAAGVIAALDACGIAPDHAVQAARRFKPLPHRMEERPCPRRPVHQRFEGHDADGDGRGASHVQGTRAPDCGRFT